jgi:hypothetical protein
MVGPLPHADVRYCLQNKLHCELAPPGKHLKFYLVEGGQEIGWTMLSHSTKDIGKILVAKMARQLRVRPATFYGAVKCTVTRAQLVAEAQQP